MFNYSLEEKAVIDQALAIIKSKRNNQAELSSSADTKKFLTLTLAPLESECFFVIYLNNQHRVIVAETAFNGTIDAAAVYPRELAKRALEVNAKAVIIAHNHPSGTCEPSMAYNAITTRVKQALQLLDIHVLDHIIVANENTYSYAENGGYKTPLYKYLLL